MFHNPTRKRTRYAVVLASKIATMSTPLWSVDGSRVDDARIDGRRRAARRVEGGASVGFMHPLPRERRGVLASRRARRRRRRARC
jgi:hypothetical protein